MTTPTITDHLKYANLQMAAEAFLYDKAASRLKTGDDLKSALTTGNEHASKFTATQATDFLDGTNGWKILAQIPNTSTGFSGTLFENRKTRELVLSFRSTEFIEDAVRDNQATNKMEIKEHGWAFGQIADMEAWYAELRKPTGPLAGKSFTLTGYSLGAHLATAFNLLHPTDAAATYTFNGAGVGDLTGTQSLAEVIADFDRMRKNEDGRQIVFTDTQANILYREWRDKPAAAWTPVDFLAVKAGLLLVLDISESNLLSKALDNLQTISAESLRVAGLTDSQDLNGPNEYPLSEIAAFDLDYQIAMLTAEKSTSSYRSDVVLGGLDAIGERNVRFIFPNFYDLYGANSAFASLLYSDVKLQNSYNENDFGDTHSLVMNANDHLWRIAA
jgi:pimeloyl-ACP methyl ester carboxylesterase